MPLNQSYGPIILYRHSGVNAAISCAEITESSPRIGVDDIVLPSLDDNVDSP